MATDTKKYTKKSRVYETVKTDRSDRTGSLEATHYHFIGAGGVGMSGLAKMMMENKAIVTGSDMQQSAVTDMLAKSGAEICVGHKEQNLSPNAQEVVVSAAIKEDNPELIAANKKGLKIYKYAQMGGKISRKYQTIAVSGTHGKSTTCGWLSFLMSICGKNPSFIVGACVTQLKTSSAAGKGKSFIVEACEYDRSFLNLNSTVSCILNIEEDHLDYYSDIDDIKSAFTQFAVNTATGGAIIANGDDRNVRDVLKKLSKLDVTIETFGTGSDCDFYCDNIEITQEGQTFDLYYKAKKIERLTIALHGEHNILNAMAVVAMAKNAGVDMAEIAENIGKFSGIDRRIMLKAQINEIKVLDDYAHHPTEIKASLSAIKQKYQPKKMFCIFQPHQYSRTRFLLDDFAESFRLADVTIVPQIYFVRDSLEIKKCVNAEMLTDKINSCGNKAIYIDNFSSIRDYLAEHVTQGDLVVTMGAGDIWKVADEYIQWLRKNS